MSAKEREEAWLKGERRFVALQKWAREQVATGKVTSSAERLREAAQCLGNAFSWLQSPYSLECTTVYQMLCALYEEMVRVQEEKEKGGGRKIYVVFVSGESLPQGKAFAERADAEEEAKKWLKEGYSIDVVEMGLSGEVLGC